MLKIKTLFESGRKNMDTFWEDFEKDEIHVRDKWQFELKSTFVPISTQPESIFSQEFYIFIPNSLQINDQTYPKARFYEDQTNLIRYQTPPFSFSELMDIHNKNSPLTRLKLFQKHSAAVDEEQAFEKELKLFANVFRSTLRDNVHIIIEGLLRAQDSESLQSCLKMVHQLVNQVQPALKKYCDEAQELSLTWTETEHIKLLGYVRDYLSISINYSLSTLLDAIRQLHQPIFQEMDAVLCKILKEEKEYRENRHLEPLQMNQDSNLNESILYQSSLLNKYFIDVLLLITSRAAIDQKYRNLIGGIAAAIAMSFYILLFIWQGAVFVINSEPFILFTVIIYVLKDRLKDELKTLSFNQAFKWFSDFKTEIISPSGRFVVGELKESFSFINENNVPKEVAEVRSREFHTYLETIKRPERVIYYKKTVTIFKNLTQEDSSRLQALNIIFRYDIHRFLSKASDPYEPHVTLDTETLELIQKEMPKIYHVNIILKTSLAQPDGSQKTELKKFRLVIDKEGIKRVENISQNAFSKEDIA